MIFKEIDGSHHNAESAKALPSTAKRNYGDTTRANNGGRKR